MGFPSGSFTAISVVLLAPKDISKLLIYQFTLVPLLQLCSFHPRSFPNPYTN